MLARRAKPAVYTLLHSVLLIASLASLALSRVETVKSSGNVSELRQKAQAELVAGSWTDSIPRALPH